MNAQLKNILLVALVLLNVSCSLNAQKINKQKIDQWVEPQLKQSYAELHEFLKIPNDSHFLGQIMNNISWLDDAFKKRVKNPHKTSHKYIKFYTEPLAKLISITKTSLFLQLRQISLKVLKVAQ